jgi:hypothetical protein
MHIDSTCSSLRRPRSGFQTLSLQSFACQIAYVTMARSLVSPHLRLAKGHDLCIHVLHCY